MTDAKTIDMLGSRQYLEEWIAYNNALEKARVREKTIWLDIRGNHGKSRQCTTLHMYVNTYLHIIFFFLFIHYLLINFSL